MSDQPNTSPENPTHAHAPNLPSTGISQGQNTGDKHKDNPTRIRKKQSHPAGNANGESKTGSAVGCGLTPAKISQTSLQGGDQVSHLQQE